MEIHDTPLRTAIMRIMSDMLDNPDEYGLFETGRFMDKIEQLLCDMMAAPEVMQLSASEALFGFMGWLSTRNETTVIGPYNVPEVNLITRFMEANNLSEPREAWDSLLTHPPVMDEETPAPTRPGSDEPKVDEEISPDVQQSILEELRSFKIAPELDHDFSNFEDGCPIDSPAPSTPLDPSGTFNKCFAFLGGRMVAKGSLAEVLEAITNPSRSCDSS